MVVDFIIGVGNTMQPIKKYPSDPTGPAQLDPMDKAEVKHAKRDLKNKDPKVRAGSKAYLTDMNKMYSANTRRKTQIKKEYPGVDQ